VNEPPAALRTLRFVERRPRRVRLARRDVAFLLREHHTHLDIRPTGRRGVYRVTPRGYVGVIVAPTCRLVLRPKLPLHNLCHLLDPGLEPPVVTDQAAAEVGLDLLEFLAAQLTHHLAERAAAGLHRTYVEEETHGPALQGRLDVSAQLRAGPAGRDRFHCRREEFTADNPCNQVPKATAEWLLASPWLGEPARARLRTALAAFANVSPVSLTPEVLAAARSDPRAGDYRKLLVLCQLLAEGRQPAASGGEVAAPAFLIDMDRVFECYVTRCLQRCHGDEVVAQPRRLVHPPREGLPGFYVRPDVIVRGPDGGTVVVDAKWKRLRKTPLRPTDIYQVLAHATALGAGQAILVYPGQRDRCWHYPLNHGPRLEIRTLRVVGNREKLDRSGRRLARAIDPER
jgi:5-methylcytosine-specific restriction enzyme subunit McrC